MLKRLKAGLRDVFLRILISLTEWFVNLIGMWKYVEFFGHYLDEKCPTTGQVSASIVLFNIDESLLDEEFMEERKRILEKVRFKPVPMTYSVGSAHLGALTVRRTDNIITVILPEPYMMSVTYILTHPPASRFKMVVFRYIPNKLKIIVFVRILFRLKHLALNRRFVLTRVLGASIKRANITRNLIYVEKALQTCNFSLSISMVKKEERDAKLA